MKTKSTLTHTTAGGTMTSDGFFPHAQVILTDGRVLHMPVLVTHSREEPDALPQIQRDVNGTLHYALPGGKHAEFVAG